MGNQQILAEPWSVIIQDDRKCLDLLIETNFVPSSIKCYTSEDCSFRELTKDSDSFIGAYYQCKNCKRKSCIREHFAVYWPLNMSIR